MVVTTALPLYRMITTLYWTSLINAAGMDETYGAYVDTNDDTDDDTDDDGDDDDDDDGRGNLYPVKPEGSRTSSRHE